MLQTSRTTKPAVGTNFVNPRVAGSSSAQPTSSRPATTSNIHAMTSLLHPVFAGPVREPSSVTRLVSGGPPTTIAPRRPRAGPWSVRQDLALPGLRAPQWGRLEPACRGGVDRCRPVRWRVQPTCLLYTSDAAD